MSKTISKTIIPVAFAGLALASYLLWNNIQQPNLPAGFAASNGRIEATEVDISALTGGRIEKIAAKEGALVAHGEILVEMDKSQLHSQKRQAQAQLKRAEVSIKTAEALVAQAEAQAKAAQASVDQAQATADAASQRFARSTQLAASNTISQQALEEDQARERQGIAGLASAQANLAAAQASITSAQAQVIDANAAVDSAKASIETIQTSIDDATLSAPRSGRIQYLIAQEGEIVGSGGRILSLVDLSDVYMTLFLPTSQAGLVKVGAEVRLVLDAAPSIALPAVVSYVADVAQFTPKTVETQEEREKLMFRIRTRIDPELLKRHIEYVKTGLPGMAYIQLDANSQWPDFLSNVAQ